MRSAVLVGGAALLPGCPQLMEDDFRLLGPDAGVPERPRPGPMPPADKCADGVMSPGELGVDCGGPECEPCACNGSFGDPEVIITGLGPLGNFYGPGLWSDNQTLYFSQEHDGDENIYRTHRDDRGNVFSDPELLGGMNTPTLDGSPHVTPDGLTLYFFSDREGGAGLSDLWVATRARSDEAFKPPVLVANVNSDAQDHFPWLTPNRLGLYFGSDRAGGQGGHDIWLAERRGPRDAFLAPSNVGELNTSANELGMTLSRDGLTIIFSSDRAGGTGDTDLWLATRPDTKSAFSAPTNLSALNSAEKDEDPSLSLDGRELFFASTRDSLRHLWHATRNCD